MSAAPTQVTIRMYNVGFGDCFGLAFHYADPAIGTRYVVIDCGTMALPQSKGKARYSMAQVARNIRDWCGGSLEAVVATHRHQDHISGFGGSAGDVFRAIEPGLVIQPWTEDPELPIDATQPIRPDDVPGGAVAFTTSLAGQQRFVEFALSSLNSASDLPATLRFLGENNISNRKAVENLIVMGEQREAEFLSHGEPSGLEDRLPGVKVHVLGPPTVAEWDAITRQRHEDDVEFWHLLGSHAPAAVGGKPDPVFDHSSYVTKVPPEARWLTRQIDEIREDLLFPIVRALDDELNNTSLILLFEVGEGEDRKLFLFPGDAQIENWQYVFDGPKAAEWEALLQDVDVYKVGHHGSLNATPKTSLWPRFAKKGTQPNPGRLQTFLSTRGAVHGSRHRHTEVPRKTLVDELKRTTSLASTQRQRKMAKDFTIAIGS